MIKPVYIEAIDIPDAWFQCIYNVLEHGFKYEIQHGSYIGQTRLEFDWITVYIKNPYKEPYDLMLPEIPQHLNIPNPVANGYIEQYLPYLMTGEKKEGEDYTYGQRIVSFYKYDHNAILDWKNALETAIAGQKIKELCLPHAYFSIDQIEHFIKLLKETPNTNQAILQIAQGSDCILIDPPCLRHIDMRIKKHYTITGWKTQLIFYPYFRSWDLWGGFPANLAAIAVLQKYMADEIGVNSGPIIASSKGLHIYGYVEELAKIRTKR